MSKYDKLVSMLEKSGYFYVNEGDIWSVFCDGVDVKIAQPEEGMVRAYAHTQVYATEENRLALVALINHIGGWIQKVGEYEIAADNEIILMIDRNIDDLDAPDRMVNMVASYFNTNIEALQLVEKGTPPSEAIKRGTGKNMGDLMRALRDGVLD